MPKLVPASQPQKRGSRSEPDPRVQPIHRLSCRHAVPYYKNALPAIVAGFCGCFWTLVHGADGWIADVPVTTTKTGS